ncbi:MAG: transglycosylase SLT domain-containing protein [SAR324 cluster bacterium]|nr:transglycosylase SLT domain-containing protein [SAR324 cluster bacterium]
MNFPSFLMGLLGIFLLLWVPLAQAQDSKSVAALSANRSAWSDILKLYKQRAWKHVILQLTPSISSQTEDNAYLIRARFLLGQSYLELGQYEQAQKNFEEGQKLDKDYPDLWTYHLMRTHLRADQQSKAIPLIRNLLQPPVNGFYLKKIRTNIANFFQTNVTAPLIFPVLQSSIETPALLLQDYHVIEIYRKGAKLLKKPVPGWLSLNQWLHPENLASARESESRISELVHQKKLNLTAENYYQRMQALRKLKLYDYLIKTIPKQIDAIKDFKLRTRISDIYLHALFSQKQYQTILKLRKNRVLAKTYKAFETTQLFWSMRSYQRLRNLKSAKTMLSQLEKTNPKSTWLPSAYRKMAETYEAIDDEKTADLWWKKIVLPFSGSREAEIAYWKLAWYRYRQKRYQDALYYINQGIEKQTLSPEVLAKFLYWKGKLEYFSGKTKDADMTFKKLQREWPNTYYNLRFLSQPGKWVTDINTFGESPPKKKFWHDAPPKPSGDLVKRLRRHEFLFMIGENEQAVFEIKEDVSHSNKYSIVWKGSELLYHYEEHHSLQSFISDYFLLSLKKLPMEKKALWKFAYPRPYWTYILQQSKKANLDPYWVLAIIREESRYDPDALSIADARGLMQLIEPTAKQVAKQQKMRLKNIHSLHDPFINIRLGTHYLGTLARQFHKEIIYAAGGYNAGGHRMKKWLKSSGNLPLDEFVESIPFRETRNYVKRVFMSYRLYKKIYQEG